MPSGAEQRRADADDRGAFRDRRFQIVRHPHRKSIQRQPGRASGIEQRPKDPELPAPRRHHRRRLGDAHEAAQLEPRQGSHLPRQREGVLRRDAAFRRLAADVDLHAHVERAERSRPQRRQAVGDPQPVDAMHPVESRGRDGSLVALQRADQVPFDLRQVGERVHLGERLLHIVLPKSPLAEPMQHPDRLRRPAPC